MFITLIVVMVLQEYMYLNIIKTYTLICVTSVDMNLYMCDKLAQGYKCI